MVSIGKKLFAFVASYGFATVIFLMLFLLTMLGTVEQVKDGLFDVQKKYFESYFLVHHLFGKVPIPLPGVFLLTSLFAVNLIAGGIIRIRKRKEQIGNFVAHLGILLLISGGLVKSMFAIDGQVTLAENQSADEFYSYHDWEIAVVEANQSPPYDEQIIPGDKFIHLEDGDTVRFESETLPFSVTVSDYIRNSWPEPAGADDGGKVVDGFYLIEREKDNEAGRNVAGAYVTLEDKSSNATKEHILWGWAERPLAVEAGGKVWALDLRKKLTPLPFTVRLNKFNHELHPGTRMDASFSSDVSRIQDGIEQDYHIAMNEPLRHSGWTFYQESYVPADPEIGRPVMSSLAVSMNPADQIPLYSCIVIGFGLSLHFLIKLSKYLRKEAKRRSA
jgi:hypothetical protein